MHKAYRILALLMALLLLPMTAGAEADVGQLIDEYIAENAATTAGLATAVFTGDSVVFERYAGYADRESGLSVTADTVIEWGSVTKLLTWVSVMQQAEAGRIDLTQDVRGYLPAGFLDGLTYDDPITMLDLMNHTPGLEEEALGLAVLDESRLSSLEEYLRSHQPRQVFRPGEVVAYSNWGVALAGYIVERVSGQPFHAYVQEHIFAPLGMQDTALASDLSDNPSVRERRHALRYYDADGTLLPYREVFTSDYPAGMCTSTLGDLVRFGQALLRRDEALLAPETWTELYTPTRFAGDTDEPVNCHGFWVTRLGVPVLSHAGNTAGCTAQLMLDLASGTGVAVLVNQSSEITFSTGIPELVFGAYDGEAVDYVGHVRYARAIFHGPLKLYSLVQLGYIDETNAHQLGFAAVAEEGTPRVCAAYGDYLLPTLAEVAVDQLLTLADAGVCVRCALLLVVKLLRLIFRRRRKPFGLWNGCMCVLMMLPPVFILPIATSLMAMQQWPLWQYHAAFITLAAACALLLAGFVHGFTTFRKAETVWQKILHAGMLLLAAVALAFIIHWELYAFWMA